LQHVIDEIQDNYVTQNTQNNQLFPEAKGNKDSQFLQKLL